MNCCSLKPPNCPPRFMQALHQLIAAEFRLARDATAVQVLALRSFPPGGCLSTGCAGAIPQRRGLAARRRRLPPAGQERVAHPRLCPRGEQPTGDQGVTSKRGRNRMRISSVRNQRRTATVSSACRAVLSALWGARLAGGLVAAEPTAGAPVRDRFRNGAGFREIAFRVPVALAAHLLHFCLKDAHGRSIPRSVRRDAVFEHDGTAPTRCGSSLQPASDSTVADSARVAAS